MPLTIRDAKLSDARSLAGLICELGYKTTTAEMQRRLKSILRDRCYRTFVIADARTEPNPEIFHPGGGRSFYDGVSCSW